MGPLWAYSDTLCARKGPKMGSILGHFRGPPNSEPPKSQIPDLRISGSRGPDLWIRLHHIVPMLLAGMSTPWCPYPHIHHGYKGHVWGCCGLYVYIYQQQKTPFWGLLKRHCGIGISPSSRWRWSPGSHLVISTMMDIMQVPLWPMVYAICLHGIYSIWYYGYMHNGISPIRMLQME